MRKLAPPDSLDELDGLLGRDWIRESTKGQFDRHDGAAQRRNCATFRDRFGVIEEGPAYVVAHSGRTVWQTETMARLIEDVRARRYRILLIGYFDRWQRNLRRTLELIEDVLHPNGVAWVMADRRLISGNPKDWQQMRREADEAQAYSENLAEKVRDGYAAKLEVRNDQGGGQVPIGFMRDPVTKLVIPDPDTMPAAIRVWELSAQGLTDGAIAEETGLGIWQVRKVLRSPLFRGEVRPGKPANFPAPIDRDLRERADGHRRARNRVGNRVRTYRVYPLSGGGPLVCDECGRGAKGNTKKRRDGTSVHVYQHGTREACPGWPVKEVAVSVLEDQVGRLLDAAAPDAESIDRIRLAMGRPAGSIDRLAVARVDAQLKGLATELVGAGRGRTDDEILAEIGALRAHRQELMATPVVHERVTADESITYLTSLGRLWRTTDDEGRRILSVAIFHEIRVRGGTARGSHRVVDFTLTPEAERHGLHLVLPSALNDQEDLERPALRVIDGRR